MSGFAFFPPSFVLVNSSGRPYAGAVARFYQAGTNTPLTVYSTAALTTALGTSVTADAAGVFPPVFIDPEGGDYKVSFFTSGGSLIRTADNLPASFPLSSAAVGAAMHPRSAAEIAAGVTPSAYQYAPGDVRRYGAVGNNVADDTAAIQAAIDVAKNAAAGGGEVLIPKGTYKVTAPLNLSGLFFANSLKMRGEGRYHSKIAAAFNGGSVFDLSGSVLVTLSDFGVIPSGSFKPDQVFLFARLASNNSAGNHTFSSMYIEGNCNNAVVVLWGSEENQFYNCWITCGNGGVGARDFPALVMAVKISEAGFTPTSTFQTLGTGSGGVGMNSFFGCRITNESGTVQTKPLMKLYGTIGSSFYNCFFAAWPGASGNTIDINGSTYPDDPASVYPAVLTFDSCSDENAWGDQSTQRTLYIGDAPVASAVNVKSLSVRNCHFFRIYGADGSTIDGLDYAGGKFSNSVPSPSGSKGSFYNLKNAHVSAADSESALTWTVRNNGESNFWRGMNAGTVALGTDTTSVISDGAGNFLTSGYVLSKSPTGGVGYSDGSGDSVTQITSASTGVEINTPTGKITTVALTTAAGAEEEFTVTNSSVTIDDVIVCSTTYAGGGTPAITTKNVANGSFRVVITNLHASSAFDAAMVINFAVVRGSAT